MYKIHKFIYNSRFLPFCHAEFIYNYTVTCLPSSLLLNVEFPLFLLDSPREEEESGVRLINLLRDVRLSAQADTETEIN